MNIRNFVSGFGQRLRGGLQHIRTNAPAYVAKSKQEYTKNLDRVRSGINAAHRISRSLVPEYGRQIDAVKSRADRILEKGDEINRRLQNTQFF